MSIHSKTTSNNLISRYRYWMQELHGRAREDEILEADPAELGRLVLSILNARAGRNDFNLYNEMVWVDDNPFGGGFANRTAVKQALAEAFGWLIQNGLIVATGGTHGNHYAVSRMGEAIRDDQNFLDFRTAALLPADLLHPALRETALRAFMRREYDNAVLQAFKAVEVAVRLASSLPAKLLGVSLMRDAFHPERGALTDYDVEGGERHARAELFAGAIGSYKNPQSHRHVALEDPRETIEQLMLASHLLHIVDDRTTKASTT